MAATETTNERVAVAGDKSRYYADRFSKLKLDDGTEYLAFSELRKIIGKPGPETKALDFGCGSGRSTAFLRSCDLGTVDGVDINAHILNHARRTLPDVRFELIENGRIPAEDGRYDLVLVAFVCSNVSTKAELKRIAGEIARVLKPGGRCLLLVNPSEFYNADWLSANTQFEQNKNLRSGGLVKTLLKPIDLLIENYFWSDDDYVEVIRDAGLALVARHRPIGKDDDGYPWVLELHTSPFLIYETKKP